LLLWRCTRLLSGGRPWEEKQNTNGRKAYISILRNKLHIKSSTVTNVLCTPPSNVSSFAMFRFSREGCCDLFPSRDIFHSREQNPPFWIQPRSQFYEEKKYIAVYTVYTTNRIYTIKPTSFFFFTLLFICNHRWGHERNKMVVIFQITDSILTKN
jgi:hypothetical protein